jgi:hypothetical protein
MFRGMCNTYLMLSHMYYNSGVFYGVVAVPIDSIGHEDDGYTHISHRNIDYT